MADKTRTKETETSYEDRAKRLLKPLFPIVGVNPAAKLPGYDAADLFDWSAHAAAVVDHFVARTKTVMDSTWSADRVAVVFFLKKRRHWELAEQIQAIGFEQCFTKRKRPPQGLRTSAKRQKSIPPDLFNPLVSELTESRSKYGVFAGDLLAATVIFGLRPCEWFGARITKETVSGELGLVVVNAKKGNGRTPGPMRTLYLTGIPRSDWLILDRLMEAMDTYDQKGGEAAFKRALNSSRNLVQANAKRLWPKKKQRPSFYSARHQFAANLKLAGFPPAVIAALMGHASDATATHLYARKGKGTAGGFIPGAEQKEVQKVRAIFKMPNFLKKRLLPATKFNADFGPSM